MPKCVKNKQVTCKAQSSVSHWSLHVTECLCHCWRGGGDRGSQPLTSCTIFSYLPYFYAPLPPDSHPPLNNSYIQVNKKDHKPDQFSLWQHSNRLSLIAGEFGLLQLARHLQIHSWPITYPNSIGIQFHQYYAVFFSKKKTTFPCL